MDNRPSLVSEILLLKRLGLAPVGTLLIACSVQLVRQVLFSWVGAFECCGMPGGVVGSPFVEGGNFGGDIDIIRHNQNPSPTAQWPTISDDGHRAC